jgi:hypothetical protein
MAAMASPASAQVAPALPVAPVQAVAPVQPAVPNPVVLPGQPQVPGQVGLPGQPVRPWQPNQWLQGPQVNRWLPQVDAGRTERVAVRLTGVDRRVCNVKVYVRDTNRVDVSYPGFRNYASLSNGSTLVRGERDSATVLVRATARRDFTEHLDATVAYDGCGWNARTQYERVSLFLPVNR